MNQDGVIQWPMVARENEFRQALAALDDVAVFRGVMLVGESGVGKTTLARALANSVESHGGTVLFVLGTQTGCGVPLGAFSRAVTVEDAHEPAAMLAAAHRNLQRLENLVVVVDDAQLLDSLSATLVYQLAADRTARLILTIRAGTEVPDAVTTLLKERWLFDLRISPLTREQTADLARVVLGGEVEPWLITGLHRRTGGNPLLLRGLLRAGPRGDVLAREHAGWRQDNALHPDHELHDLLGFRLRSLDRDELDAIEILATADLLDWEILRELCDPDAVERLERAGLIQLVSDGSHTVAELNHPVIGEVALQLAGVVRSRKLNGILTQAFRKHLSEGRRHLRLSDLRGQIQLAQFMMRSDLPPDLGRLICAAENAILLSNIRAGADLARYALDHGGGLPAALILADALRWQGRSEEAEALLSEFDPQTEDAMSIARWGCLRAMSMFDDGHQVVAARQILAAVQQRLEPDPAADLVRSADALFAFLSGELTSAIQTGLSVCESTTIPMARVWASISASLAMGKIGSFAEAADAARAGVQADRFGVPGAQLLMVGMVEVMALTGAGDLAGAQRVIDHYSASSINVPSAEAILNAARGHLDLFRGSLAPACTALGEAASVLAGGFQPVVLVVVSAWLAQAEGARGDAAAAAAALDVADGLYGPHIAAFQPELELARAWVRAANGQVTSACRHAIHTAEIAHNAGMVAVEMRALHTAVRFGDYSQASRLAALSSRLAAPLPDAIAVYARAATRRDGELFDKAAERFAELGFMTYAADAAAQAACEHGRKGDRVRELESAMRAYQLAQQTGLRSPAAVVTAQPLPLTTREREVATMVAFGRSNREIAEELGISVRTIEGHLYRMFAKLDIQQRDQLAQLVGCIEPSDQEIE